MNFLNKITGFIFSHDFQVSFWSGLAVSAVVGFVVYQYTDLFKTPNLSFVVKQDGFYRDSILLSEEGKYYRARFQFAIKNSGNKAVRANEGYWHLYIDSASSTLFSAPGESNHNRGLIDGTIYPGSFLDIGIVYDLKMKKEDSAKNEIPYFFSTDYGQFPRTAKVDPHTGKIFFKDMGWIKYEIPEK
jgi:hypothetical protein